MEDLRDALLTVTILILVDGFLQYMTVEQEQPAIKVTILILVDGFLQYNRSASWDNFNEGHNPYFSRWFSAI